MSGLNVRLFTRRGPVWRCEDRVQYGYARSIDAVRFAWFSQSRLNDRLPIPPFDLLTSSTASQRSCSLSNTCWSSVYSSVGHKCPGDPRNLVGHCHNNQHGWFAQKHALQPRAFRGTPFPGPMHDGRRADNQKTTKILLTHL